MNQQPLHKLSEWRSAATVGDAYEPIAYTTRNDMVESVHHGAVVVIDSDGQVARRVGDPELVVYPRSSLKPFQADAMIGLGLQLTTDQLALACASHDGTPRHTAVVTSTLIEAGLTPDDLQNTPDLPLNREAADQWLRAGGHREPLLMNCSGKHAAMLATCVANDWPINDYLNPEHPVQVAINDRIAELADGVAHVGIDGCGAPTHAVTLSGIARALAKIANTRGAIWTAMSSAPELIGGEQRHDTVLMRGVPGLIAKGGAEGVFVAAIPDGPAVAVKVADGAGRASAVAAVAALAAVGVDVSGVDVADPILGHGKPVGTVKACIS